jgi:hypothetical protein
MVAAVFTAAAYPSVCQLLLVVGPLGPEATHTTPEVYRFELYLRCVSAASMTSVGEPSPLSLCPAVV